MVKGNLEFSKNSSNLVAGPFPKGTQSTEYPGSVVPLAMFCLKLVCDVTSAIDHDLRSLMTKSV